MALLATGVIWQIVADWRRHGLTHLRYAAAVAYATGAGLLAAWFFVGITMGAHVVIADRDLRGPFLRQDECVYEGDRWAAARPCRIFPNRECFYDDALAFLRSDPIRTTPDPQAGLP